MKSYGPIGSLYKDCVVPKPSSGSSDGTSFGSPLTDGKAPTGGELKEVQFSDGGPKAGAKQPGVKIPGGGTY